MLPLRREMWKVPLQAELFNWPKFIKMREQRKNFYNISDVHILSWQNDMNSESENALIYNWFKFPASNLTFTRSSSKSINIFTIQFYRDPKVLTALYLTHYRIGFDEILPMYNI